jgi:hypothetical protein
MLHDLSPCIGLEKPGSAYIFKHPAVQDFCYAR